MPINLDAMTDDTQLKVAEFVRLLQPKTILCYGRPFQSLAPLLKHLFPGIRRVIVSEDSRYQQLDDFHCYLPDGAQNKPSLQALARFNNVISTYCTDDSQLQDEIAVRYRLHCGYRQLVDDCPGQRLHVLRAITAGGDEITSDVWLNDPAFRQKNILEECVCFPS